MRERERYCLSMFEVIKEDQQRWKDLLRVKKILFTVTGLTVDGIARTLTRPRLTVTVAQ
jgi:hypothetical protein